MRRGPLDGTSAALVLAGLKFGAFAAIVWVLYIASQNTCCITGLFGLMVCLYMLYEYQIKPQQRKMREAEEQKQKEEAENDSANKQ